MAKPIETISISSGRGAMINASIWENEVEQDDNRFTTHSVTIEKRYQKDGSWHTASSFNANELLVVAFISNKAYERVLELRSQASTTDS